MRWNPAHLNQWSYAFPERNCSLTRSLIQTSLLCTLAHWLTTSSVSCSMPREEGSLGIYDLDDASQAVEARWKAEVKQAGFFPAWKTEHKLQNTTHTHTLVITFTWISHLSLVTFVINHPFHIFPSLPNCLLFMHLPFSNYCTSVQPNHLTSTF